MKSDILGAFQRDKRNMNDPCGVWYAYERVRRGNYVRKEEVSIQCETSDSKSKSGDLI